VLSTIDLPLSRSAGERAGERGRAAQSHLLRLSLRRPLLPQGTAGLYSTA
jgi:hypothetical protein